MPPRGSRGSRGARIAPSPTPPRRSSRTTRSNPPQTADVLGDTDEQHAGPSRSHRITPFVPAATPLRTLDTRRSIPRPPSPADTFDVFYAPPASSSRSLRRGRQEGSAASSRSLSVATTPSRRGKRGSISGPPTSIASGEYISSSSDKPGQADAHARFSANPYAAEFCPWTLNYAFGLEWECGMEFHPDARDFLLEPGLDFPWDFGRQKKVQDKDARERYKSHAEPYNLVMRSILEAVFSFRGFSWDGAIRVLVRHGKTARYRGTLPQAWDLRSNANIPNPSTILKLPDDIIFYCLVMWYGRDAFNPDIFVPSDPSKTVEEQVSIHLERGEWTSVLDQQLVEDFLPFEERERSNFSIKAREHFRNLSQDNMNQMRATADALAREAHVDPTAITPDMLNKWSDTTERILHQHRDFQRSRRYLGKMSDPYHLDVAAVIRESLGDVITAARERLNMDDDVNPDAEFQEAVASQVSTWNGLQRRLYTGTAQQTTDLDDIDYDFETQYTGEQFDPDDPTNVDPNIQGMNSLMSGTIDDTDETFGVNYLEGMSVHDITGLMRNEAEEANGIGARIWPGVRKWDRLSPTDGTDGTSLALLALRHTQAVGAYKIINHAYLDENDNDWPDTAADLPITQEHSSVVICTDDVGMGKTGMVAAVVGGVSNLAEIGAGEEAAVDDLGLYAIASRKELWDEPQNTDALERYRAWGSSVISRQGSGAYGTFAETGQHFPRCQPILIIVPTSALGLWSEELNRFLEDHYVHIIRSSKDAPTVVEEIMQYSPIAKSRTIVLLTRDTVLALVRARERGTGRSYDGFFDLRFSMGVIDEAHSVRNPRSETHKALKLLMSHCDLRILLTATPTCGSMLDMANISVVGMFGGVKDLRNPDKRRRPEWYEGIRRGLAQMANNRRQITKNNSQFWHYTFTSPAEQSLVTIAKRFSKSQQNISARTDDNLKGEDAIQRWQPDMFRCLIPLLLRRTKNARDHRGQKVLNLGKCRRILRLVFCSQDETDYHRNILAKETREKGITPDNLRKYGAFYHLGKRVVMCPTWVGFPRLGYAGPIVSAKLREIGDILEAVQKEDENFPDEDKRKVVMYYPYVEDYPPIIEYLRARGIYLRILSGDLAPDIRTALLKELNKDEDHESEPPGPGERGQPTRFILASKVMAESVNLFRFHLGINGYQGFNPSEDDQFAGRLHRTAPDTTHRYHKNPPDITIITLIAPGTADEASYPIQLIKALHVAQLRSTSHMNTSMSERPQQATTSVSAIPGNSALILNKAQYQTANFGPPTGLPGEEDRRQNRTAHIKRTIDLGPSFDEIMFRMRQQPNMRHLLWPQKRSSMKITDHSQSFDLHFDTGEKKITLAEMFFRGAKINEKRNPKSPTLFDRVPGNGKPTAIHLALASGAVQEEEGLERWGIERLTAERAGEIMQLLGQPQAYEDVVDKWQAAISNPDPKDSEYYKLRMRLAALHQDLQPWREHYEEGDLPPQSLLQDLRTIRVLAHRWLALEPGLHTLVIPDEEDLVLWSDLPSDPVMGFDAFGIRGVGYGHTWQEPEVREMAPRYHPGPTTRARAQREADKEPQRLPTGMLKRQPWVDEDESDDEEDNQANTLRQRISHDPGEGRTESEGVYNAYGAKATNYYREYSVAESGIHLSQLANMDNFEVIDDDRVGEAGNGAPEDMWDHEQEMGGEDDGFEAEIRQYGREIQVRGDRGHSGQRPYRDVEGKAEGSTTRGTKRRYSSSDREEILEALRSGKYISSATQLTGKRQRGNEDEDDV